MLLRVAAYNKFENYDEVYIFPCLFKTPILKCSEYDVKCQCNESFIFLYSLVRVINKN